MLFNFWKCKCLHTGHGNLNVNYKMGATVLGNGRCCSIFGNVNAYIQVKMTKDTNLGNSGQAWVNFSC